MRVIWNKVPSATAQDEGQAIAAGRPGKSVHAPFLQEVIEAGNAELPQHVNGGDVERPGQGFAGRDGAPEAAVEIFRM